MYDDVILDIMIVFVIECSGISCIIYFDLIICHVRKWECEIGILTNCVVNNMVAQFES